MKTRTISWLFELIFVAVGILGFTPNSLVGYDGIYASNAAHNLIHILTSMVFLVGVIKYKGYEGRIHINEANRWLHLG